MNYTYNVTKQYGKGGESGVASFYDINDAKVFIEAKIAAEKLMGTKVIYRISKYDEVIETFDSDNASSGTTGTSGSSSSTSQSSGSRFSPTPFNTAPKPAGTPQKWVIPDEDDNQKE